VGRREEQSGSTTDRGADPAAWPTSARRVARSPLTSPEPPRPEGRVGGRRIGFMASSSHVGQRTAILKPYITFAALLVPARSMCAQSTSCSAPPPGEHEILAGARDRSRARLRGRDRTGAGKGGPGSHGARSPLTSGTRNAVLAVARMTRPRLWPPSPTGTRKVMRDMVHRQDAGHGRMASAARSPSVPVDYVPTRISLSWSAPYRPRSRRDPRAPAAQRDGGRVAPAKCRSTRSASPEIDYDGSCSTGRSAGRPATRTVLDWSRLPYGEESPAA